MYQNPYSKYHYAIHNTSDCKTMFDKLNNRTILMHYSVVLNISWSSLVSFFFFYPQNLPLEKQFPHTVRSAQQTWDSGLQCTEEQTSAECHLAADHCVINRQAKLHYIHKNSACYIVSCGNQSIYRIPTLCNSVNFVSCFVTLVKQLQFWYCI